MRPKIAAGKTTSLRRTSASDHPSTLRGAGLRRTGPRVAVLERLEAAKVPLSHGDVVALLAPAGFDRATIYRNLMDLVSKGLVRRADLGDHVWRFELVRGDRSDHKATEHAHFICTDCGGVSCLPGDSVRVIGGRGRPRALSNGGDVEVQLRGRCDECAG